MSTPSDRLLCENCKTFMLDLLDKRMRRILQVTQEVAQEDNKSPAEFGDVEIGQSHCFHLMELRHILEGKPTCGVFDDYGSPPTISGPLLQSATGTEPVSVIETERSANRK